MRDDNLWRYFMRAQYPDSLGLPGLSDQTLTLASVHAGQRPTSASSSAVFAATPWDR
jgi:hypothetical protein